MLVSACWTAWIWAGVNPSDASVPVSTVPDWISVSRVWPSAEVIVPLLTSC
ncbi:MAG TPA: hypothetical protein VGI55_18255 [Solirubrobacteraceae bacterium]